MSGPLLQFPLVAGMDEGVDPKTMPPGRMTKLVNAAWTKDGRLEKRLGTFSLASGPTAAKRIVLRGTDIGVWDGQDLWIFMSGQASWTKVGKLPECGLTWSTLTEPLAGVMCSDIGITSDLKLVHAWVSGDPTIGHDIGSVPALGRLSIEVTDLPTGTRIATFDTGAHYSQNSDQVGQCRVVVSGTSWAVFYSTDDGGSNGLIYFVDSSFTVTNILNDGHLSRHLMQWDAHAFGSSAVLAYGSQTGAPYLTLKRYDFTGALVTSGVVTGETASVFQSIAVHVTSGESLYVAYACEPALEGSSHLVRYATANPLTLVQVLAPTTVEDISVDGWCPWIGVTRLTSASAVIAYSFLQNNTGDTFVDGTTHTAIGTTGGAVSAKRSSAYARILSHPFVLNGMPYIALADWSSSPWLYTGVGTPIGEADAVAFPGCNSYVAAIETNTIANNDVLPHRIVGQFEVLTGGAFQRQFVSRPVARSSEEVLASTPFVAEAPYDGYNWLQGAKKLSVTIGDSVPDDLWKSVSLGAEAYIAGGSLFAYDGRRPFDFSFPRTTPISFETSNAPGGNLAAGTYTYSVVPTFRSAAGVLHRGPASPPLRFTVALNDLLNVCMFPQTLGWKGTTATSPIDAIEALPVYNEIYRSAVGGSTLYKLTLEPTASIALNDPQISPNFFFDKSADNSIGGVGRGLHLAQRPVIYNVEELDEYAPAAQTTIHLHRNRLFIISGDERTIWVSKDITENPDVAPGFNPTQILTFEDRMTGLRSMDETLVAFSESRIYAITGDGPSASGEGGFSTHLVQADNGCANPRSLVSMPEGIMFQGDGRLLLLTRGMEVLWIGKPVQDQLFDFPYITSAVLVPSKTQVRFTCNDNAIGSATSGIVLAYDYARKQWSRYEYYDTAAARAMTPIADAVFRDGLWMFVTPGGKVYLEDDVGLDHRDDQTHFVVSSWETGEINQTGPLGYERVRRAALLGDRVTDCDVTLKVAINGSASYDQTANWNSAALASVSGVNVGLVLKTQKARSFRLAFSDAAPSSNGASVGNGQGVTISALAFEIVPLPGIERRPAGATK